MTGRQFELTEETLSALYGVRVAVRTVELDGESFSVSIPHEME